MSFTRDHLMLRGDTPGSTIELPFYRIGPATASEKVYLQAALHADEQPGTMLLHHLLPMLRQADEQELLRARFVVIPIANPMGMANLVHRTHIGRYDLNTGVNYNRQWPDLFAMVRSQLAGRLNDSDAFNVNLIRRSAPPSSCGCSCSRKRTMPSSCSTSTATATRCPTSTPRPS